MQHDPPAGRPGRAGGLHELSGAEGQELGAYESGRFTPSDESHEHDQHHDGGIEDGGSDHQQREPRHREHGVGGAHERAVDESAHIAREGSDGDAHDPRDHRRKEADGQRDAGAVHHAGEDVSPELVRSEPVRERRRCTPLQEIQLFRPVAGDQRRGSRQADQQHEEHAGRRARGSLVPPTRECPHGPASHDLHPLLPSVSTRGSTMR